MDVCATQYFFSPREAVLQVLSVTVNSGNLHSTAVWDQSSQVLSLVASATNTAASALSVTLPSTLGCQVPVSGLSLNQKTLQYSSNATAGPILLMAIPLSNSVGIVSDFTLTFNPRKVDISTSISVSMILNADLEPQNMVYLILPGFTGSSVSHLKLSAATTDGNHVPVTGRWDLASTTLTVQVQRVATRNKRFSFTVDASSNLQLPSAGIQVNHTGFSVSTNSTNGHVTAMPVSAQSVSLFSTQKIELDWAAALMPCGINL